MLEWATPAVDMLTDDERQAVLTLRSSMGFDVLSQPLFWETLVARQLGGETTAHGELHDVEVTIWGRPCCAEVKFARAYHGYFNHIRGKDWSRKVFKWAKPRGGSGKNTADAVILIGMDEGMLFSWVVPLDAIKPTCASITMTTPASRTGVGAKGWSAWDAYAVPFDALLPAFACVCHNKYDAPMRRAGIRERAQANQGKLI